MSSVTLITQVIFAAINLFAVVSLILLLKATRKSKQLIKARLFLQYDKIERMALAGVILFIIVLITHLFYTLLGGFGDDAFASFGSLLRQKIYTFAIYIGIAIAALTVYRIIRTVGK
jgi:hypothetical protein